MFSSTCFKYFQYVLPSFRGIPKYLEIGGLDLSATSKELFAPEEVEPVENALATFTTGSTGMPKLVLRRHSFLVNQSKSLSMSYELMGKEDLQMEEEEVVFCTNLSVFPLHYLKVGYNMNATSRALTMENGRKLSLPSLCPHT